MSGFGDSKSRNKHFKKHVMGKPANAYGSGSMLGRFPDAKTYERSGVEMFGAPTTPTGIIEIGPHPNPAEQRQAMVMRWDRSSHDFATMDPTTRRLATYHNRGPESFLEAVSQQRPDVLPRTIHFRKDE